MTWIDNTGEVRPQSWEEYLTMREGPPLWWMRVGTETLKSAEETYRPARMHDINRGLRLRLRLHRADPHCFWCGQRTYLNLAHATHNLATVDHLYSRLHPQRSSHNYQQSSVLHVLACYKCNHRRSVYEQQRVPFVPALRERLEFAQLADATLAPKPIQQTEPKLSKVELSDEVAHTLEREAAEPHPARVLTLKEESLVHQRAALKRRTMLTLKEAIEFARDNPAR